MASLDPTLPTFKYHPDPIAAGVIERSDTVCRACGFARSCIYAGPVRATEDLHDAICPRCIANGNAHATFGAEFAEYVGNEPGFNWDPVSPSVGDEVLLRTPGFYTWQYTRWWTRCRAGKPGLTARVLRDTIQTVDLVRGADRSIGMGPAQAPPPLPIPNWPLA